MDIRERCEGEPVRTDRRGPIADRLQREYDELVRSGVNETIAEFHWDEMLEREGL